MKLWIRLDAGTPRDPKITELARALGVHRAEAFGLAASVWCVMAEHAVDGSLAEIADEDLEAWAYWQGRTGRFAPAFRKVFCDAAGTVGGWSERQGKLLERMERDRERHRKVPGDSPEPPRKPRGNSAETPRSLIGDSTSTVRNGTVRKEQVQKHPRASARAAAKYPHFPDARCKRWYAAWQKLGTPDYSVFRKTFSRLSPEVPPFTDEQVERAIGACIEEALAKGRGEFVTPSNFVDHAAYWVDQSTPIALKDPARAYALGIVS